MRLRGDDPIGKWPAAPGRHFFAAAMLLLAGCSYAQTTQPATPPASQPATSQPASSPITPLSNFHAIVEGRAYRCAQPGTDIIEHAVREHKIRTIVNLRGENEKQNWYQIEKAACARLGVRMIDIRLSASAYPSRENLLKMYDLFADPANEPILLHCKSGADRSGMAAALWRMTALKQDAKTALAELSMKYGHFRRVHPEMSKTVELYQPRRDWIEKEYSPPEPGKDSDD